MIVNYPRLFGWALRIANSASRRDAIADLVAGVIVDQVAHIAQGRQPTIRLPPLPPRLYGPVRYPQKDGDSS